MKAALRASEERFRRQYQGSPVPTFSFRRVEDDFVLGYGLHTRDLYRNLPFVAAGDRDVVAATPSAYVEQLYGGETPGSDEEALLRAGGSVTGDRTEEP